MPSPIITEIPSLVDYIENSLKCICGFSGATTWTVNFDVDGITFSWCPTETLEPRVVVMKLMDELGPVPFTVVVSR